jgi:hypothetical protein
MTNSGINVLYEIKYFDLELKKKLKKVPDDDR